MIKAAELADWMCLSCWSHNLHNAVNTALAAEPTVGKAVGAQCLYYIAKLGFL